MTAAFIALIVGLAAAGAFVSGTLIYVLVSYLLMASKTPRRALSRTVREMARETGLALVSQPFLPLYYFVGRRFGRGGRRVPIVLVHGYAQNRIDFVAIARALDRQGLGPIFGFNYPWMLSVHANAMRLHRFVERVRTETAADQIDLVCHSMGGLVAIEAMRAAGLRVRKCVTIATPHAGVSFRGPIPGASGSDLRSGSALVVAHAEYRAPAAILSIASSHDNVVHPMTTSSLTRRGGDDVIVGEMGHLAILFARETIRAVTAFLGDAPPPQTDAPTP